MLFPVSFPGSLARHFCRCLGGDAGAAAADEPSAVPPAPRHRRALLPADAVLFDAHRAPMDTQSSPFGYQNISGSRFPMFSRLRSPSLSDASDTQRHHPRDGLRLHGFGLTPHSRFPPGIISASGLKKLSNRAASPAISFPSPFWRCLSRWRKNGSNTARAACPALLPVALRLAPGWLAVAFGALSSRSGPVFSRLAGSSLLPAVLPPYPSAPGRPFSLPDGGNIPAGMLQ